MPVLMGCLADDFTGATDLANELQRQGLRTILFLDNVFPSTDLKAIDAVVIALKIRTAPIHNAISQSMKALNWLKENSCQFIYYKYCSTFDSTDQGNIGPVIDALLDDLNESFTIASPAFPRTGRSVYQGYLFVGSKLLGESHMRFHPLTPMTESNLVELLRRQSAGNVGLISWHTIKQGERAIREAFQKARQANIRCAVVDAIEDSDLIEIGRAAYAELKLLTGASGVAYGLAKTLVEKHLKLHQIGKLELPITRGSAAVIAGSCSHATLKQIEWMKKELPCFLIDILQLADGKDIIFDAMEWAKHHLETQPVLIHTSVPPNQLKEIQTTLGTEKAGQLAERALSQITQRLVDAGVRRLIVAGGETAGAVVKALKINAIRIGPEIDPGVPWTIPECDSPMLLSLKSGNFGSDNFFEKAFAMTS